MANLGQWRWTSSNKNSFLITDNDQGMTLIDAIMSSSIDDLNKETGILLNKPLQKDVPYRLIYNIISSGGVDIILANVNDSYTVDSATVQYLVINKNYYNSNASNSILFTPLASFNAIIFRKINKTNKDDKVQLGELNNHIWSLKSIENIIQQFNPNPPNTLLKIGVRSTPGSTFCLNGEEIKIGQRGVYEFKNDTISIDFFSIIDGDKDYAVDYIY